VQIKTENTKLSEAPARTTSTGNLVSLFPNSNTNTSAPNLLGGGSRSIDEELFDPRGKSSTPTTTTTTAPSFFIGGTTTSVAPSSGSLLFPSGGGSSSGNLIGGFSGGGTGGTSSAPLINTLTPSNSQGNLLFPPSAKKQDIKFDGFVTYENKAEVNGKQNEGDIWSKHKNLFDLQNLTSPPPAKTTTTTTSSTNRSGSSTGSSSTSTTLGSSGTNNPIRTTYTTPISGTAPGSGGFVYGGAPTYGYTTGVPTTMGTTGYVTSNPGLVRTVYMPTNYVVPNTGGVTYGVTQQGTIPGNYPYVTGSNLFVPNRT